MSNLRFLADESCDFAVIRSLRDNDYDVLTISEFMLRSLDRDVIARAYREDRILLTEDKGFGWLVFASHSASAGVILIPFPGDARATMMQSVLQVVEQRGRELREAFVVIQPGQVRFSHKD